MPITLNGVDYAPLGRGLIDVRVFFQSGTYIIPANSKWVHAMVVGGGGSGGGAAAAAVGTASAAAGGGSGAYAWGWSPAEDALAPGSELTITVGAGGASVLGDSGQAGGYSSIYRFYEDRDLELYAGGGYRGVAATHSMFPVISPPQASMATASDNLFIQYLSSSTQGEVGSGGVFLGATTTRSGDGGAAVGGARAAGIAISGHGRPGLGPGSGGSGALNLSGQTTAKYGGAGQSGCVTIEIYG